MFLFQFFIIGFMFQARQMGLLGSKHQWLFVTTDTHSLQYDMVGFLDQVEDGDNMAFAYNMSEAEPTQPCEVST